MSGQPGADAMAWTNLAGAVAGRRGGCAVGHRRGARDGSWFPISPEFDALLGYPRGGPTRRVLGLIHPVDRAAAVALFSAARASPAVSPPIDLRLRAASGRWIVLETVASGRG